MAQRQYNLFNGRSPPGRRGGGGDDGPHVFTVSRLVRAAHSALEQQFSRILVEGEISNLRIVGSGHAYFTLKDDAASLPVALWRSTLSRLRFRLHDGLALRVGGRLGIYPAQGKFQLYAEHAEPAGLGSLMQQLERLKAALYAEGLFDPARKRPLPVWPRRIGVVTSATGAAIHDILKVTRRRCPSKILLAPALVQGEQAPRTLLRALTRLQAMPEIDVIIIGRGGGAAEDLWAFNDEALARAIAACPVPVVSAVGHEVDVTICDLVADVRAATPSHAAELVTPELAGFREQLDARAHRIALALRRQLIDERARVELANQRLARAGQRLVDLPRRRLAALQGALERHHPRRSLARDRKRLEALRARLIEQHPRHRLAAARAQLEQHQHALTRVGPQLAATARARLGRAASALQALSPLAVLERGYAVAQGPRGRAVVDADQLAVGDELALRFHRGRATAQVVSLEREDDPAKLSQEP